MIEAAVYFELDHTEAREARWSYDPDRDARDGREDFDEPMETRFAALRRAVFAADAARVAVNAGGSND